MFEKDELERYARQILLIGRNGQKKLKEARVLVIGAGGLGSAILPYLASSGVGYIRLAEHDTVEQSNLGRQILYKPENVSGLKGPHAVNFLNSLNPYVNVEWSADKFSKSTSEKYLSGIDFVLEGSDDIEIKFLTSDLAVKNNISAIIAGIGPKQGHILPVSKGGACYRCLFEKPPENPEEVPTCSTEGILSPLPGIIGSMMAYLTVHALIEGQLPHRLYLFENTNWRTLAFEKNRECNYC
ncbi:MAG: HesA/MoeB/ThiF family protein [Leptospirales bacterium]